MIYLKIMSNSSHHTVIGSAKNFWLYSENTGYDLTHPPTPSSAPIFPRVTLNTTSASVTLDPAKTALVIVDMQNFFLSPSLGKPKDSKGLKACEQLVKVAIPAARKAGIRIVWLNWGLTQSDIDQMPPATLNAFGALQAGQEEQDSDLDSLNPFVFRDPRMRRGLGSRIGRVQLEDGSVVDAGRFLMRDQWNTALYGPLEEARQQGIDLPRGDIWIHKDRISGLWGSETMCTEYLNQAGIKTLLFAGVNTDQCVGGSLQDAYMKGYDCLLLTDAAATTSPAFAQQCVEFNVSKTMGFALSCAAFAEGVQAMETAR